jgi:hypothetical protein
MDTQLYSLDAQLDFLGLKDSDGFQAAYDSGLRSREDIALNLNDFEFAEPQIGYKYSLLELEGKLNPMAAITGYDSEPLPVGKDVDFRKLEGTIPRQRILIQKDEEDYRNMLQAEADARTKAVLRGESPYDSVYSYLAANLFDTFARFTDGHAGLVNNMIGKILSKGAYTVTDDNNPQGGIRDVTFSAQVPDENKVSVAFWYVDSNGENVYDETVDPIKVFWKKLRSIRDNELGNGYDSIKVRVGRKTFYDFIEHPKVKAAIGYALNGNLRLTKENNANAMAVAEYAIYHDTEEALVSVVRTLIGADVLQLENTVCAVSKYDKDSKKFVTSKIKAFEEGVFSISPTGVIGSIRNVIPVRPDGSAVYAYIYGNRGIIEYDYDVRKKIQTMVSELTVLPVPNNPSRLFYYNVIGEAPVVSGD